MESWNPFARRDKKILAIVLAAFMLLGIALGLELSRWFSGQGASGLGAALSGRGPQAAPRFHPAPDRAEPLSFQELMRIVAPKASEPVADRFAAEFLETEPLREAWDEYKRTDDFGGFVDRVHRSPEFTNMLDRFGKDERFRTLAEEIGNHPKIASWVGKAGSRTESQGERSSDGGSGLSMIRAPRFGHGETRGATPGSSSDMPGVPPVGKIVPVFSDVHAGSEAPGIGGGDSRGGAILGSGISHDDVPRRSGVSTGRPGSSSSGSRRRGGRPRGDSSPRGDGGGGSSPRGDAP